MNYTTIEQSRKLLELGLKPETADAYYKYVLPKNTDKIHHVPEVGEPTNALEWYNKGYTLSGKEPLTLEEFCIPCWSLEALLEALPTSIQKCCEDGRTRKNYDLNLFRSYYHCCSYTFGPSLNLENHDQLLGYGGDTWMEAVYNIALKLAEKGWLTCERMKPNWVIA